LADKKQNGVFYNVIVILSLLIFQQSASAVGRFVANIFTHDQRAEYGIFTWISIHHITQMLLAIIVIVILAKVLKLDFGFSLGDRKVGMEHVVNLTIVVLVYALIWRIVVHLRGNVNVPDYPLNFSNIAGEFGFQLLLSGPSEEILFRALPIIVLVWSFRENKTVRKIRELEISLENLIAALFFTIAHISWTISPFSISASWIQMTLSMILGLWFGIAYKKSKSIIYPMAMHSIWNVVVVGAKYIHLAFLL